MALKQLATNKNLPQEKGELMVRGLTADSRKVQRGFLFAALAGTKQNGAAFIQQAIERGAVAVLTSPATDLPPAANGIAHITADNPRKEYALMAARFFPSQYSDIVLPQVIAVTGTNGKTSVAFFARYIWQRLGFKAASVGTLGLLGDAFV